MRTAIELGWVSSDKMYELKGLKPDALSKMKEHGKLQYDYHVKKFNGKLVYHFERFNELMEDAA